jgi:hypothetical protein
MMVRSATKRAEVAEILHVSAPQVPAKLRELHEAAASIRGLADFLAGKGVAVSKSWLQRELANLEEDPS